MHFGSLKYPDYLIYQDDAKKERYLARAKKIRNKAGNTPGKVPSHLIVGVRDFYGLENNLIIDKKKTFSELSERDKRVIDHLNKLDFEFNKLYDSYMLIPHYSEHEKSSIEGIIDAFNDRVYIMQRDTEDIKFIKNQNVFFHSNF